MYLTGFADEAADGIEEQIRATKELGWKYIEARSISGKNIHDLSDEQFDYVYAALQISGIRVNCFGSAIANHSKRIDDPTETSIEEAKRAITRMKKLGVKLIRIMSYALFKDRTPENQMKHQRFERLRTICKMFLDQGITPVHENCMNYGGMGWKYTLELLENVPGLKLVFDTGNPVVSIDYSKTPPSPPQSAWEFYSHVRDHVVYVHIKDAKWDKEKNKEEFTFPGEGEADVERIVRDLLSRGYNGGFSMEPHMAVVFHDDSVQATEEKRFRNYVEYGTRFMKMLAKINEDLNQD